MDINLADTREMGSHGQRDSGFELLRILSMFGILYSHFFVHSGMISYPSNGITFNKIWSQCMMLGNLGSDIFILISGYFLYGNKRVRILKLVKMILAGLFYSMTFFILIDVLGGVLEDVYLD